jgi:hypothetical protein
MLNFDLVITIHENKTHDLCELLTKTKD